MGPPPLKMMTAILLFYNNSWCTKLTWYCVKAASAGRQASGQSAHTATLWDPNLQQFAADNKPVGRELTCVARTSCLAKPPFTYHQ